MPRIDDSEWGEAWKAFAEEDARNLAPQALEDRVFAVLRATAGVRRPRRHRRVAAASFGLAAAILVTTMWSYPRPHLDRSVLEPLPTRAVRPQQPFTRYQSAIPSQRPLASPERATVRSAGSISGRQAAAHQLPPPLLSLGAGPLRDQEVVQLVRLRIPREALQGLGLALIEPDAGGVVDIDVLIGEDGLARDIRQVRAGVTGAQP